MPLIKSAKKRVRVTRKATARNARTKRNLKDAVKTFHKALGTAKAGEAHAKAQSALSTTLKKKIIHKNKAARKQRQLAAAAKKAGVKPAPKGAKVAKTAAKTVAKKPAAKKAPAKKTAKKA